MHTDIIATGWVARLPRTWLPYLLLARMDRPIGTWLLFLPGSVGHSAGKGASFRDCSACRAVRHRQSGDARGWLRGQRPLGP